MVDLGKVKFRWIDQNTRVLMDLLTRLDWEENGKIVEQVEKELNLPRSLRHLVHSFIMKNFALHLPIKITLMTESDAQNLPPDFTDNVD